MNRYKELEWSDIFSVDIEMIDSDHRKVLSIYNKLVKQLRTKKNTIDFVDVLSEMTNYALKHFKMEEAYMERIAYPKISYHRKLHQEYAIRVAMFNVNYLGQHPTRASEVLLFIKNWWENHIKNVDKEYADFAKETAVEK